MSDKNLKKSQIFYYSILAFPLSFVGLPIYLNISDFYAKKFELSLSLIGVLLILVRAIDLIQDPVIGYFSDVIAKKRISRKRIIYFSSTLLALCFYLLFNPLDLNNVVLVAIWFFVFLTATYTFFNFAIINFESIAAIISNNKSQRISINSSKEFFGLLGVLFASILPFALIESLDISFEESYLFLSLTFIILVIVVNLLFFRRVELSESFQNNFNYNFISSYKRILQNKKFSFFLLIFLINAVAVSIPSAVIIFYVEDVLQAREGFGVFLAIYFLSGALFISLWKILAQKFGKVPTWIFSIFGSVITFIFAYFLDAQTANYFYLVCFLSGAFLGADLIMPPAIIADLSQDSKEQISSYFSLWNVVVKLGLMIASSSSLIILGFYEYQPGAEVEKSQLEVISFIYAILPSILKILVIFLLFHFNKILQENRYEKV